jgi:hypothetical protein
MPGFSGGNGSGRGAGGASLAKPDFNGSSRGVRIPVNVISHTG